MLLESPPVEVTQGFEFMRADMVNKIEEACAGVVVRRPIAGAELKLACVTNIYTTKQLATYAQKLVRFFR